MSDLRDIVMYPRPAFVIPDGVDKIAMYAFLIGIARDIVKMNHGSVFVQKANPVPIVKTMVMLVSISKH